MSAIERVETPISMQELERRWAAVRKEMEARNIDALITQNSSDWLGGYVKWFTDVPAHNDYPRNVIFHRDDLMTVVEMGNKDRATNLGGKDPLNPGVGDWIFSPSFFSVAYTHDYDARAGRAGAQAPRLQDHRLGRARAAAIRPRARSSRSRCRTPPSSTPPTSSTASRRSRATRRSRSSAAPPPCRTRNGRRSSAP